MNFNKTNIAVFIILSFTFIIRLIYLYQIQKSPFFSNPLGDPLFFDKWAMEISNGNFYTVFFKAPLYTYLLGALYSIFGKSFFVIRFFQVFLGTFNCLLTYLIAYKIFNKKIAIISLILISINGPLIYFGGEILIPTLLIFLIFSALFFLIKAIDNKKKIFFIISGLFFGLAIITRPNILIFIFIFLIYYLIKEKKKSLVNLILFILAIIIIILPITIRNFIIEKDFIPISSQGGVIFYIGNNPLSNGKSAVIPGVGDDWDEVAIAEKEIGKQLKPSEVSNFWFKKTLKTFEPQSFLKLFIKKNLYFINGYEIPNNQDLYDFTKYSTLLKFLLFKINIFGRFYLFFPSLFIISMGLSGLILSLLNKERKSHIIILYFIVYSFSIVIFFVCSRYRQPIIPILIIFSSYFILSLYNKIKTKDYKKILIMLLILILLFSLNSFDFEKNHLSTEAMNHYNLGLVELKNSNYLNAINEFKNTISIYPSYQRAHLNLGLAYYNIGKFDKALIEYSKEISINPNEASTYNNIAVLYSRLGIDNKAIENWNKSIELRPKYEDAYLNLAIKYEKLKLFNQAEEIYKKLLIFKENSEPAHIGLGRVYEHLNKEDEAISEYLKAIKINQNNAETYFNISIIYIQLNYLNQAEIYLKKAIIIDETFVSAYHNLALVHYYQNNFKEAIIQFKTALAIDNTFIPSHLGLAEVYEKIGDYNNAQIERNIAQKLSHPSPL